VILAGNDPNLGCACGVLHDVGRYEIGAISSEVRRMLIGRELFEAIA
jgi:hypothetical protein